MSLGFVFCASAFQKLLESKIEVDCTVVCFSVVGRLEANV